MSPAAEAMPLDLLAESGPAPRATRFAADSLLEEAVTSEPVSVCKFPASSESAGNFARFGYSVALQVSENVCESKPLRTQFPRHPSREFLRRSREFNRAIRERCDGIRDLALSIAISWYLRFFFCHLMKSRWLVLSKCGCPTLATNIGYKLSARIDRCEIGSGVEGWSSGPRSTPTQRGRRQPENCGDGMRLRQPLVQGKCGTTYVVWTCSISA